MCLSIVAELTLKDFWAPLIQVLAPFLAAGVLIWQSIKQRGAQTKLQRDNIKYDFKTKLHERIEDKIEKLSDFSVEAAGMRWNLGMGFAAQKAAMDQGVQPPALLLEWGVFMERHNALTTSAIEVIKVIEKYEIMEPAIKIFQIALNVALFDLRAAHTSLVDILLKVLPLRSPDGLTLIQQPPLTPLQAEQVNKMMDKYGEAADEFGNIVYDMRVEIQNLLLGELFERKVPKRKPMDPTIKVISTEPKVVAELEKFYENETAWGKNKKEAEEYTRKRLNLS